MNEPKRWPHSLIGNIALSKPPGFDSWEIVVTFPRYEIVISTPNLTGALAFAQELIGNATTIDPNGVSADGKNASTGRISTWGFAFDGDT